MKKIFQVTTFAGCLFGIFMAGCNQPLEQIARNGIATAKGYIAAAAAKHGPECIATAGKAEYCDVIVKAAYAENAAVDALETYCQLPAHTSDNPTQPCQPLKSAAPALTAALENLNALSADLKGAAQ